MKPCLLILSLLAAIQLRAETNGVVSSNSWSAEHRRALVEPVPENRFAASRFAARYGLVPTNTLAFREYALDLLLAQANLVNENWHLGLPRPLTSDHVTGFYAVPQITGVKGSIMISNRFRFSIENGKLQSFRDDLYSSAILSQSPPPPTPPAATTNGPTRTVVAKGEATPGQLAQAAVLRAVDQKVAALAKMTNWLTKETAVQVARDALHGLGFTEQQLHLCETPSVEQFTYTPPRSTQSCPLPLYTVRWRKLGSDWFAVEMEVSGVTRTVVDYFSASAYMRVIPVPTNYFEMLGVPPTPRLWGKQYGYDPINTDEFQQFARGFLAEKANWLNEKWRLGLSGPITTNSLDYCEATPFTNRFAVWGQISNRLYLQITGGRLELFQDYRRESGEMTRPKERMQATLKTRNQLTKAKALALAREALRQLGLDEQKLHLPAPRVTQVQDSFPDDENETKLYNLPFYEVMWGGGETEYPLLAMEVSGLTKTVTRFVDNRIEIPGFALPTNYLQILGLQCQTNAPSAEPPPLRQEIKR